MVTCPVETSVSIASRPFVFVTSQWLDISITLPRHQVIAEKLKLDVIRDVFQIIFCEPRSHRYDFRIISATFGNKPATAFMIDSDSRALRLRSRYYW